MPTLKIQKADGTFEFLQLAGEEFADIGNQVLDVKSQITQTETDLEKRGIDVTRYGVIGDGIADETIAIQNLVNQVPDNSTLFFPPHLTYKYKRININGKTIHIQAYGAKFIKDTDDLLFAVEGGYEDVRSVDSLTATSLTVPNHNFNVGDVLKLVSDDIIEGFTDPYRYGIHVTVASVTTNVVTLQTRINTSNYLTNVRVGKIKDVSFSLEGATFDTPKTLGAYIRLKALKTPTIKNVHCLKGFSSFIITYSCFSSHFDKLLVENLADNTSLGYYGYGVLDQGSENTLVSNSTFIRNRHGYTTGRNDTSPNNPDLSVYGQVRNSRVINCFAIGCTNMGFDTHQAGVNIEFVNCRSVGSGFQSRSIGTTFENCVAVGMTTNGFRITNNLTRQREAVKIINCSTFDVSQPLDIKGLTVVEGGRFHGYNTRMCDIGYNLLINGTTFIFGRQSGTHSYLFEFTSGCNVEFKDVKLDLTESLATETRPFRIVDQENTKLVIDGLKITGGEGKMTRLFEHTTYNVFTNNISVDFVSTNSFRNSKTTRRSFEGVPTDRPWFIGEMVFDSVNLDWYIGVGTGLGAYKKITV